MPDVKPSRPASNARSQPFEATPKSLTGHAVPEARRALIEAHVAVLAQTALNVSDELPFHADYGDIIAVMDQDADQR